ncbi:DUF4019 domain-containing protein [Novosphingobium sp. RD2P27]|uniref:DUF4019 domain-containing protein n=1 Tax=Novosphingobium kalidii TaxID=3230299 RepID=A0ABV2CWE5_9SPHN
MISIAIAVALASATNPKVPCGAEPAEAAAWVSLLDQRHWDESWAAAGPLFKSQTPQARWASIIEPVREPLGAVSSRAVQSVTNASSLPGVPDGQYQVVKFHTSFAHKKGATETVVLACEPSGWKVSGYFIR